MLARLEDDELHALLDDAEQTGAVGVGGASSTVSVDGDRVFVKRLPVTSLELAHPLSTANLFGLPVTCHYGMHPLGSPGFSAWRELAANRAASDAVLAGRTATFALLHHWRVLPGRPPPTAEHEDVDAVVAQFGGDQAVRVRLEELAAAPASVVLVLEHAPVPLLDTLTDPLRMADSLERQLLDVVASLRELGILHMDGHFGNLRSDGEQLYLVDFGLATSTHFELSDTERVFFDHHRGHDADYAAMRLVNWLVTSVCGDFAATSAGLLARDAYVQRCADGDLPPDVPTPAVGILSRHAPTAARMNDFHRRLVDGDSSARYVRVEG